MIESIASGLVAIAVCMINNVYQHKAAEKQHDKTIALIDYKLVELTKRVDKHNNVIERTYKLEEMAALSAEKLKVANHRIDDLEAQIK